MENLLVKIELARSNDAALNELVAEYLPFIRQEAGKQTTLGIEYDDRVSLGMIAFVNCVRQYDSERGNFASYVAVSVRNRLIDEAKRQSRYSRNTVPLEQEDEENNVVSFQYHAAVREHQREAEGLALAEEIDRLTAQLDEFGIKLGSLDRLSPKHQRVRNLCAQAARALAGNPYLMRRMMQTKQLPVSRVSVLSGVPVKTIEKFRKYIITVALIYFGDFAGIEEFLPKEVETIG